MKKSIAKYEAFKDIIESGRADTLLFLIYKELLNQPQTIVYFRQSLRIPHQSCTASISRLEDTGFVYKYKTIEIDEKKFTLYNAETDFLKARERAIDLEMFKREEWLNRGYKMGWINYDNLQNLSQLKLDL